MTGKNSDPPSNSNIDQNRGFWKVPILTLCAGIALLSITYAFPIVFILVTGYNFIPPANQPNTGTLDLFLNSSYILWTIFLTLFSWVMLREVRSVSAHNVGVIGLGFSFSFCLAILFTFFLQGPINALDPNSWVTHSITDFWSTALDPSLEIEMIAAVFLTTVAPELMSYVLNGILCCASRPRIASIVTHHASCIMMKAFVTASGFQLAYGIHDYFHPTSLDRDQHIPFTLAVAVSALSMFISVVLAWIYIVLPVASRNLTERLNDGLLKSIHIHMTKVTREQASTTP
ncbi:hypothetical protein [Rhizobium lusitanum]|uniref:Uncharacterized protein n=1 Tax=Rhizobium lusitanum TaxID=293958 RepID=A0A1C3WC37_9HYPH|nr:hypothetical protein [Rhizobium lusitanum]SCB37619.1 hypothetical protein GA0061101_11044 [Rhizobium lusitanum]